MFFFFNGTATPEFYTYCHTLSLHAALPICSSAWFRLRPPRSPGSRRPRLVNWRGSLALTAPRKRHKSSIGTSPPRRWGRSEEHTSEPQSLMRISYAVFCLKKKTKNTENYVNTYYNARLNSQNLISIL